MNIELLVSSMMRINVMARLWHWMTDIGQHHTTFETFLTQNETLTDSLMESALGNEMKINFSELGVKSAIETSYSIETAKSEIKHYRTQVMETKSALESSDKAGTQELVTILDDVVELSSKTLYLLNLK